MPSLRLQKQFSSGRAGVRLFSSLVTCRCLLACPALPAGLQHTADVPCWRTPVRLYPAALVLGSRPGLVCTLHTIPVCGFYYLPTALRAIVRVSLIMRFTTAVPNHLAVDQHCL